MYREKTCGELTLAHVNKQVTLAGWVSRVRKMGGMTFIDLRDRYGITQLSFNQEVNQELFEQANKLGREWVVQVSGKVSERLSKNKNIATGEIEIIASELNVLNASQTRKVDFIKKGEEILGSKTKVRVVKNKLAPPFKVTVFDIDYGKGISKVGEIIDFGVEANIIKKSGAWYSYNDIKFGQGKENVKSYLLDNPEIIKELEDKVYQYFGEVGLGTELADSFEEESED